MHSPLCSSSEVDEQMWRYQRPGFEALLLAELQRQQQCSQFCDTLLKAGGITVPAHSCVLSVISSHLSSALSSTPAAPTGQSRLLEFGALGSCTLLHMVSLLYSGEMMGQGEKERQEAVTAASKLGIHGLVEVTERVRHTEVGVQTERLMNEENGARPGGNGRTLVLKESNCEQGTWTQVESELDESCAHLPHPAASSQTINMTDLQSLGDPSSFPYIPVSFICPPDGNLDAAHLPPFSVLVASTEEATVADHSAVFFRSPSCSSVPPSIPVNYVPQEAGAAVVATEEWEAAFQNSIPEFIDHFFNLDMEEDPHMGPVKRGHKGKGTGGDRRTGTEESRVRRPRASTSGKGRGVTHTLNVQEVKGSKLQMKWLHRWGLWESRKGQGGGTMGRKPLKPQKSCQKRGGGGKLREMSQCEEVQLPKEQRGKRRDRAQQPEQDDAAVGRGWRARAQEVSISPSVQVYNQTWETRRGRPPSCTSVELDNKRSASRSQPPRPTSGSSCPCPCPGGFQNKQGLHGSAEVIAKDSSPCVLALQQLQGEGELGEILDNFLQNFELLDTEVSHLQPHSVHGENSKATAPHLEHTHSPCPTQALSLQSNTPCSDVRSEICPQSVQKQKRMRKPVDLSDTKTKIVHNRGDTATQKILKVQLDRLSCQSQIRNTYPLRSCVKQKHFLPSLKITEEQLSGKQPLTVSKPAGTVREVKGHLTQPTRINKNTLEGDDENKVKMKRGRPWKIKRLLSSCNCKSSRATTSSFQTRPVELCRRDEHPEQRQERREVVTLPPQEHAEEPVSVGTKMGMESEEDKSEDANVAKRVCFEQMAQPNCESAECVPGGVTFEKGEETDDVEGDTDDLKQVQVQVCLGSTASGEEEEEEDIDVVGGVSPTPIPEVLTISWTAECSESDKEAGDEEIDVVGEVMDCASAVLLWSL